MIHRSVFQDVGVFDEDLTVCEDYDLWLRIARKYEIGLLTELLVVKYGGHDDQLSRKYPGMDMFRIAALEKHMDEHADKVYVVSELIYKCRIVSEGALKRENWPIYEIFSEKLKIYEGILNKF